MEFKESRTAANVLSELLAEKGLNLGNRYMYEYMRGEVNAYDIAISKMEAIIMGFKAFAEEDLNRDVEEKLWKATLENCSTASKT